MEVNFEDFIGHYKGWFSDDNIQEFLDYYNHIEKIGNTKSRREAEGSQLLHKADSSVCLEWNHEVYNDATFGNFLKYLLSLFLLYSFKNIFLCNGAKICVL